MRFNLSYPVTRPFSTVYTVTIAVAIAMFFVILGFWTHSEILDCIPFQSDTFIDEKKCSPITLGNNTLVHLKKKTNPVEFSYPRGSYSYTGANFTCLPSRDFRVVIHSTRVSDIYLVGECTFDDISNTNFKLTLQYTSGIDPTGYYANFDTVTCNGIPAYLESIIFDTKDNHSVFLGDNINNNCRISVNIKYDGNYKYLWPNERGQLVSNNADSDLGYFFDYMKSYIANYTLYNAQFDYIDYQCKKCVSKSLSRVILTLLVTFSSIGATVYQILVFIGQKLYEHNNPKDVETERLCQDDMEMQGGNKPKDVETERLCQDDMEMQGGYNCKSAQAL